MSIVTESLNNLYIQSILNLNIKRKTLNVTYGTLFANLFAIITSPWYQLQFYIIRRQS